MQLAQQVSVISALYLYIIPSCISALYMLLSIQRNKKTKSRGRSLEASKAILNLKIWDCWKASKTADQRKRGYTV